MRKFNSVKKIICILFFPLGFFAQALNPQGPIRFLALGDSYTIGESVPANERWPSQLMDSLALRGVAIDTMRIIATTGWRTDNLLNTITNQHLEQQHYNLVSVLIGVNNQYQTKPISQYLVEFPQLLDSAIRYAGGDTSHVFIVSIPDYAATPFGQSNPDPVQISSDIDQYNVINKDFADSFNIRYFDITPISRLGLFQPTLVANDGLHPSGAQYTEWINLMLGNDLTSVFENMTDKQMKIYPNPVTDHITVSYPTNTKKNIEVYDGMGKLMMKQETENKIIDVPLSFLDKGIYIIRVVSENRQIIKKIIKD